MENSGTTAGNSYPQCPYCGLYHQGTCPKIESIEYHQNGTVKKITFRPSYEK